MDSKKTHVNSFFRLVFDIVFMLTISIFVFFLFQYSLGYFTNENLNIDINIITRIRRIGRVALISNIIYIFTWYFIVYMLVSFVKFGKKVLFSSFLIFVIPLYIIDLSYMLTLRFLGRTWLFDDITFLKTSITALKAKSLFIDKEFLIASIVLITLAIIIGIVDKYLYEKTDFYNKKINYVIELIILCFSLFTSNYLYNHYLFEDSFVEDMVYTRGIVGNLLYRYKMKKIIEIKYEESDLLNLYKKYNDKGITHDTNFGKFKNKNVIIIVEESFSEMYEEAFNYNNTRFIHGLKNADKGNLYIYNNSGLTAYSEYEFFTGLSISRFPKADENQMHDSIINKFNNLQYNTSSIHFCTKDIYRYGIYYDKVGFKNRYFKGDGIYNYEVGWIPKNDLDTFNNLLRIIKEDEEKKKDKNIKNNELYYVVTTSAHDLSNAELYKEYDSDYKIDDLSKEDNKDLNDYLTLVKKNDSDLEYLFNELKILKEEYLVLVFGDHPFKFKNNFNSKVIKDYYKEKGSETPFLFWSNKDSIKGNNKDVYSIPYLYLDLLNYIGFEDNALTKFLREMREHILAMNDTTFYSTRLNRFIPYNEADEKEKELISEYDMINQSYFDPKNSELFFK